MTAPDDNGPLVKALEFEKDGKVIDIMEISPPVGTFSRRMERLMSGILMQADPEVLIYEVGTDNKRLD